MAEKVKIAVYIDPSDAKKGGKEVIQVLNETEESAASAGRILKGAYQVGNTGTKDLIKQKNSVEDLNDRIKDLTKARDKWADPSVVTRYNRKIDELNRQKSELTGTTKKLTQATNDGNSSWRIGTIAAGNLVAKLYQEIASRALDVIKASRQMAFEVEETNSKYETVVGDSVKKTNKFINEYRSLLALTKRESKEYVSQAVQVGKSLDMQGEKAAEFGINWVKLAGEYQSFFDIPFEQAFTKIRSGITGQFTPLKQLGIAITENEVKERALLQTGKKRVDVLNEAEKAQARYSLILEKSQDVLGNMERSQEHAASKTREMEAAFRDIAEEMSTKSIPLWKEIAQAGLEFSKVLKDILGISVVDKIQEERLELNQLANQLIDAVNNGQDRNDLISELNENYPDYLKNLDQEALTASELVSRLKELNKAYDEKALVQIKQEELAKLTSTRSKLERAQAEVQVNAVKALIEAEKKLGVEVDYSSSFWQRRNKMMQEANKQGAAMTKHNFSQFTQEMFDGTGLNDELQELNSQIEETQELYSQLENQFKETKIEVEFELDVPEEETPEVPVKPVISSEKPIDELLEDSLPGEVPEFKVAPKIELGSLSFMRDQLANEEALYTAAATDEERKRHQVQIEFLEKRIQATEEGISVEQLKAREAHQEKMQQAVEYFDMLNQGYQLVADYMGAQTERKIHNIEREQDKALSAIDARLNNDKLSEKEREKLLNQREKAETEYQKKIDKLQHEQFEREQIAKIAEVAANTAVAVSKVWGQTGIFGLAAQVPVLAMGALQAATVLAQPNPYLEGGMIEERLRSGMSSPGKKLISINENDQPEFIMNAVSTARSLPLMNRMNKDPEFADRINKAYLSQKSPSFSKPDVTSLNAGIDSNAISAAVGSAISEAMKDVKLYPKITYSEILEAQRQYDQNREAVGNQS
ncbi:MAG: hypothetical protein RIC57_03605 [Balneola sp.]